MTDCKNSVEEMRNTPRVIDNRRVANTPHSAATCVSTGTGSAVALHKAPFPLSLGALKVCIGHVVEGYIRTSHSTWLA